MPAETNARKRKEPNQGRPFGSVTRFPGSVVFSRQNNTTQGHLYRVLTGERKSARIVNAYADFLRAQNIPWPAEAVVTPGTRTKSRKAA